MKQLALVAASTLAFVAIGEKISIDYDECAGVDVPAGTTVTQTDAVILGDGGTFVKAGEGTYAGMMILIR